MATQLSDGYTTPMATGWLQETQNIFNPPKILSPTGWQIANRDEKYACEFW